MNIDYLYGGKSGPGYGTNYSPQSGARMEVANSFSELNDPDEQRRRFQEQEEIRKKRKLEI